MSRTLFCRASTACALCPKALPGALLCAAWGARFWPAPGFLGAAFCGEGGVFCAARLRVGAVGCGSSVSCGFASGAVRRPKARFNSSSMSFFMARSLLRPNGRGRCAGRCAVRAGLPARGRPCVFQAAVPGTGGQEAAAAFPAAAQRPGKPPGILAQRPLCGYYTTP